MPEFSAEERSALLKLRYIGPTTLKRLESIGVYSFKQLAQADCRILCEHIEADSGIKGWATHSLAIAGVSHAIDYARNACTK